MTIKRSTPLGIGEFAAACLCTLVLAGTAGAGQPVAVADDGEPLLEVVVGEGADERTTAAAANLAAMLGRITGASFDVGVGDGTTGIAVGTVDDFPALELADAFDTDGLARREQYLVQSHDRGVHVAAATPLGVQHGVWDLLHHLGYRRYFPGAAWEVVPNRPTLSVAIDVNTRPDYHARRIWYGYGFWDHNDAAYGEWQKANRAVGGFSLSTGHAYDQIYSRNRDAFDGNPAFFAEVDGVREHRGNIKFCLGNPDARALIVQDRVRSMRQRPADSISMDPSDGGGWCECDRCAAIGSVTDQALLVTNEVAEALVEAFGPEVYVGMYAYNQHSPPPSIEVHPNVIVSVATSFIRGGYTLDQLIEGWAERGARLGIREYYAVHTWDRDLPGRARGANLDYLARTIPYFHQHGARFMSAESSDNWGPNGLGYYLAQRMMWDVSEAERLDELTEDFLTHAFGDSAPPMRAFYELIDGANQPLMSDDLLGRLYRHLDEAWHGSEDEAVRRRVDELTLWVHYVELFRDYSDASGSSRQQAFETLIRHGYRMRDTMLVHSKALYRDLHRRDRQVTIPADATWDVPEAENPWKDATPFSREELDDIRSAGIANHDLISFRPVAFGTELAPAAPLLGEDGPPPAGSYQGRGRQVLHTWVAEAPTDLPLEVTGGLIAHYRDRGDVTLRLFPADEVEGRAVAEGATAPDGETRAITLHTDHTGHHRIEYSDGSDMTRVTWPEGVGVTWEMGADHAARFSGRQTVYFYVPQGTAVIGGYATSAQGHVLDPEGERAFTFDRFTGYFEVPVGDGHDGRLWRFSQLAGRMQLLTVPPQVSPSPQGLLLPREVIETDSR